MWACGNSAPGQGQPELVQERAKRLRDVAHEGEKSPQRGFYIGKIHYFRITISNSRLQKENLYSQSPIREWMRRESRRVLAPVQTIARVQTRCIL